MIERIEGIVTDKVKHNDAYNVVTLFTRTRGRMAFLVPVGKSKSGRMRNSVLSLMAVVTCDVNIVQGKELYTMRNVQSQRLWHGIYSHPVKNAILFFLTEFCHKLLRQYPADEKLWLFIMNSLELLDVAGNRQLGNFHLAFLIRMLPVVGIEPPVSGWEEDMQFDMLSGEMVLPERSMFIRRGVLLSSAESRLVPFLMRMTYANMTCFRFDRPDRNRIIEKLLAYYNLHLSFDTNFKTLPVLTELFQ